MRVLSKQFLQTSLVAVVVYSVEVHATPASSSLDGIFAPNGGGEDTAPATPEIGCYTNLTILAAHMRAAARDEPGTYVICPNTVYEVGQPDYADAAPFVCKSGQSPLFPRSYTKILCGDDGRSENNCILRGGPFQVIFIFATYWDQVTAAEISGVTFESSQVGAVLLGNGGDITFRDCIFRNHNSKGAVISHFGQDKKESGKRFLLTDELATLGFWGGPNHQTPRQDTAQQNALRTGSVQQQRGHQIPRATTTGRRIATGQTQQYAPVPADKVDWKRQHSRFENCLFENNAQGHTDGKPIDGVITIELMYDDMEIINSTFTGNFFGNPADKKGYAVSVSEGSTLVLKDNCFINNNFVGDGIVLLQNEAGLLTACNNFVTLDDGLQCQFIAITKSDPDQGLMSASCIDADAQECSQK